MILVRIINISINRQIQDRRTADKMAAATAEFDNRLLFGQSEDKEHLVPILYFDWNS